MLALMALRPLRLGNFTSLDLGGRFSRLGETWQIQRALCGAAHLEPAAVRQGPANGQTTGSGQSAERLDHQGGSEPAHHR